MEVLTINEIKTQYPDQWVLVGNPVMDVQEQQVLAGLPVFYSKSKKEVCYLGAELVKKFDSTILLFTGQPQHLKRVVATVFNSRYNGLLGIDFFEDTKFCIDTTTNELTILKK